ncbi:MAG: asparagine synthase (glutamine-hydrolyzing) [Bacilli bacterium]|nr:asparagine synthase (glutamine-hydrolyzing) [Bacilli bacterium]
MCGIAGFINGKDNKKDVIKKMTDRIIHRGPDAEGFYIDDNIALGHRRLSIIDLSSGDQPIYNEDKTIVTVFNGEIYNYLELKSELTKCGHKFKTNCDTEVLVHGYEEWKEELPKKLRGMFAFAIYDIKEKVLFLVRDNFGIKPLYFYNNNGTFMFASEIKSFLEHEDFVKELNKEIIPSYMSFSFTPTKETLFKGVYRVDSGTYMVIKNGKIKTDRYFNISFNIKKDTYEKTVDDIDKLMHESVEKHMISDVEVGSFLSSGIDSSYLVALAKPDKTYTVGYSDKKYNEIEYAKDLTSKLSINNTSKIINKEEYLDIIQKIMYHLDEPTADPAAVALYFVAELASKDVKVVLSGEGADEFFGGYNFYRSDVDVSWYNKVPRFIRRGIAKLCLHLPEIKGLNFLVRRGLTLEENYIGVNKVYSEREAKKIYKYHDYIKNQDITKEVYDEFKNSDDITKMQAIDINFWLIKDILQKADRMTMAHSLEGRVPFIDKEVFKYASSLPIEYKVTKENTKVALRDAAKRVIPTEAYKKKKLGFPVPLRSWMKDDDFYNEIKRVFNLDIAKELFNVKHLVKLLDNHRKGKKDNYKKVWTIYCFLRWYEVYFIKENI